MKFVIRKELFWDVDYKSLDEEENKQIIIERVLNYGNLEEFKSIVNYYGYDVIRQVVYKVGYLDPKTLEFVTSFLNIDKEDLPCYTRSQLHHHFLN